MRGGEIGEAEMRWVKSKLIKEYSAITIITCMTLIILESPLMHCVESLNFTKEKYLVHKTLNRYSRLPLIINCIFI